MSAVTPQRIDPASTAVPHRVGQNVAGSEPGNKAAAGNGEVHASSNLAAQHTIGSGPQEPSGVIPVQDEWLRLHATDLIDRLQAWASDLDAREAQLNSRTSIQEHRERRFRVRQQDLATELAEQQRSIERLRHEIKAQARRLAFQNDPG